MTLEIGWVATRPIDPASSGLDLELSEGQVRDVLGPIETASGPERRGTRWRLGGSGVGRVRTRVEAPVSASLVFHAGGQVLRIPLAAVLEGPQRTPASAPVEITVERLPWDALSVALPQGDGTVAPGALVPLSVGFNILTPEPIEVAVTCTAELRPARGGEPGWRHEQRELVATNALSGPARAAPWSIPAPRVEGTYVLELRCTWEPPAGGETTRLGRWFRRRWNPQAVTSASRRMTFTVVDPRSTPTPAAPRFEPKDVESIDLTRLRDYRPTASGRAPLPTPGGAAWVVPEAALVEATRRDRLRGWIVRSGPQPALAPADATGLAWTALGLKVAHPGRPHRLTLTTPGAPPAALGVALVESSDSGPRPQLRLDACASGGSSSSWLVWPDEADPVLVLVNRDPAAPVQLGTVTLTELAEVPPPPPLTEPGNGSGSGAEAGRTLGLYVSGPAALDRFGGGIGASGSGPADPLAQARNFALYASHCGATTVVLAEAFADRARRRALDGQASEDALGADRLELLLRVLDRQGLAAWLEPTLDGPLPGLPPADSDEARARGLVRVDRLGHGDGATYHALHPDVREALKRRVASALAARGPTGVRPRGLLVRLGRGPTLLGGPDTGADDATYARFVHETFGTETARGIPGLEPSDPERCAARAQFLAGSGRNPWLNWRAKAIAALYAELAEATRRVAPGAVLAVVTPGLDEGPAGSEARRVDLSGLAPIHAWRAVGFDLETWPVGDDAPLVLRGAGLSSDDLARDLATSPELDATVLARPRRGLLIATDDPPAPSSAPSAKGDTGLRLIAPPLGDGTAGDELLGHGLAVLDARWMMLSAGSIAGREERVRQFARVFRALPSLALPVAPVERPAFGVAVRTFPSGARTFVSLANDTPYPIRLETMLAGVGAGHVHDLGRGLRLAPESAGSESRLVLDLAPFGVAAIGVGAAGVKVSSVTPHPSDAVLADLQARSNALANQLTRLSRTPGASKNGPPNPGFEPLAAPAVQLTGNSPPAPPPPLTGWQAVGAMGTTVELDPANPHSGRGSLRIVTPAPGMPSGALSEPFPLAAPTSLTLQGWFRSDRPDAKVRLWIEGQAAGQPVVRQSELAVSTEWSALAIKAANLPGGGLESARLRLELLTGGTLWVDDLALSGETVSEAERLNTRRALVAALHAYREKRYADFARLAGSHWARHPGLFGTGSSAGDGDRGEMIRTGDASALPPGRRLR